MHRSVFELVHVVHCDVRTHFQNSDAYFMVPKARDDFFGEIQPVKADSGMTRIVWVRDDWDLGDIPFSRMLVCPRFLASILQKISCIVPC